ncbi:hypothetical protein QOZ94_002809 [Xanthobacter agilis]|uniref:Uncharacterized protein n=1 Tax=Xanthobacter agilis TaxID=47492 RepID=A0ABU0LFT4_XANAG|nr:hypothetical protein [Xanthobacter agilis]
METDMRRMITIVPSPGSDAAIALGCTCPVLDNGHGRGYMGRSEQFWVSADCPIHGDGTGHQQYHKEAADER